MKGSILVVDDDRVLRSTLEKILQQQSSHLKAADDGESALKILKKRSFDLVITDLRMGEVGGMEILKYIKSHQPATEVIVLTGFGSLETAVEAIKTGAFDYLTKPVEPEKLLAAARNALVKSSLEGELKLIKDNFRRKYGLENIVGRSKSTIECLDLFRKIAPTDSTVLITGETGVGKQLAASAIYTLSDRADRAFVEVNCAALPQELLESELFGHIKGAFTGAMEEKKGLFEAADGGTVFLDEIGVAPAITQAKLLKAIDERTIRKVGSIETLNVDVRIIACTNRDLATLVKNGEFRQDLFYRLNVLNIYIPPLRERKEDIIPLVRHFIRYYRQKIGKPIPQLSPAAEKLLLRHHWPGNVRELKHSIERAAILCEGPELRPRDFQIVLETSGAGDGEFLPGDGDYSLAAMESAHIERVLEACEGNQSLAASRLGIGRNTLADKIKKYKIKISPSIS